MKRGSGIAVLSVAAILMAVPAGPGRRAQAAQAKQVTFTGKVLDATGQPIEGVKVRLYQEFYGSGAYAPEATLTAEVTAQADGSFSFSVPALSESYRYGSIVVEKEHLAIGFASWDMSQDRTRDITLGAAKPLAGVVVDESGQPIPEASVSVYLLQIGNTTQQQGLGMRLAPQLLTTRTDAIGRFAFTNLPAEAAAELLLKKPGRATVCTFTPSEYAGQSRTYRVGQTDIRLTQPTEAKIEGVVIQKQTGQPVAGVTLLVMYAQNRALDGHDPIRVNADGTFTLPALSAGQYSLQLATLRDGLADWVAAPMSVTLKAGETKTGLKFEVSKGGMLEVAITDAASNKPLEKASVNLRAAQGGRWFGGTSDAEGIARIRLAAGTYQMQGAFKQGYSYQERQETITIEEGATKRVAAALKAAAKVRGVVRDPDGAPVAGVQIRVLPAGYQDVASDAEGRFEVTWDRQGWPSERTVFCLPARHAQRNLAAAVDIAEGTNTLDVKLEPGMTIAGRIADPNGKGIARAQISPMLRVSAWGSRLSRDQIQTDSSGNFEIRAVPPAHRYDLHFSADGYGSKHSEMVETNADATRRLDIGVVTLPVANLSVSGRVVDLQDQPVANATISVSGYGDGQPDRLSAQTDAQGRFTLKGVCQGRVNLRAEVNQGNRRLSANALTDGGSTDIKIVLREGSSYTVQRVGGKKYDQIVSGEGKVIAGVAVDEKGSPVVGVRVQVCCHKAMREGRMTWRFSDFRELSAMTDAQGRFAIELTEDGEYNLLFSPDKQAALIVYDVPVGQKDLKVILPEGAVVTGRLSRVEKGQRLLIPNAEVKIEQTDRASFSHLGFDRDRTTTTDGEGRFRFEHISTQMRSDHNKPVFIPRTWKISHANVSQTIAFDDDKTTKEVDLVIKPDLADASPLAGRPLPGFDGIRIDLTPEQIKGKRVLVCFFDWEQRPSRNCVLQLAKQAPSLGEKGVAVAAVHVSKDNDTGLRKWAADSKIPLPVGTIGGEREEVFFAWSVKSLPWLVLTDASHLVTAEGFSPDELDKKLAEAPKANR